LPTRVWLDDDAPSQSIGSTSNGRLTHGHPMPLSGPGFVTYSYLGASLGRQYVHGAVRDLMREAFAGCAAALPLVLASPAGRRLGKLAGRFLRRPVWWRHDEHVHVDFALVVPR
jgi:murein endopeptidase